MKRVGIITFHAAHNFGSALQAYALQQYVLSQGYECRIINLRTKEQKRMYAYPQKKAKNEFWLKYIIKRFCFRKNLLKSKSFERFFSKYYYLTDEYAANSELKNTNLKFDYYIAGSDQIWNFGTDDFNTAYLLDFVSKDSIKISYAASFGSGINIEGIKKYLHELSSFNAISLREKNASLVLKEHFGLKCDVVVDPTLLFDSRQWCEMLENRGDENLGDYIFFYSLGYGNEERKILRYLRKFYKLPIVIPHQIYTEETFWRYKNMTGAGPESFIALIRKAKFVFTTSFHGCAFSILFHKDFFAYMPNEKNIDERKKSILELCGIEERGVYNYKDFVNKFENRKEIDFSKCDTNIENKRIEAREFLKRALCDEKMAKKSIV